MGVQDDSANDRPDPFQEDELDDERDQEAGSRQVHGPQLEGAGAVNSDSGQDQSGQADSEGPPQGLPEERSPDGSDQDTNHNQGDVHHVDEVRSDPHIADTAKGVRPALRGRAGWGAALTLNIFSSLYVLSTHDDALGGMLRLVCLTSSVC